MIALQELPTGDVLSFDRPRRRMARAANRVTIVDPGDGASWSDLQPESFDAVLAVDVFQFHARWPAMVEAAAMALRPGGSLIVEAPCDPTPARTLRGKPLPVIAYYANLEPGDLQGVMLDAGLRPIVERHGDQLHAVGTK